MKNKINLIIRHYKPTDIEEVINLFYNTVHSINTKDYTKAQVNVWASKNIDLDNWNKTLLKHHSFVVTNSFGKIIGFGDIDSTGYLDKLFVHKDFQNIGIATLICDELEKINTDIIFTYSSITAKPFFEKRNYKVIKEQEVECQGIKLKNYLMEKIKKRQDF